MSTQGLEMFIPLHVTASFEEFVDDALEKAVYFGGETFAGGDRIDPDRVEAKAVAAVDVGEQLIADDDCVAGGGVEQAQGTVERLAPRFARFVDERDAERAGKLADSGLAVVGDDHHVHAVVAHVLQPGAELFRGVGAVLDDERVVEVGDDAFDAAVAKLVQVDVEDRVQVQARDEFVQ